MALQNLASRGPEMIPASVSSMINRKHLEKGLIDGAADDIQWCILSGKSRYKEHLPLLSRTTAIFRVRLLYSIVFLVPLSVSLIMISIYLPFIDISVGLNIAYLPDALF